MATLRRNDSRPEECSISSFSQQAENIFTFTSHKFGLIKIFVKVKGSNI